MGMIHPWRIVAEELVTAMERRVAVNGLCPMTQAEHDALAAYRNMVRVEAEIVELQPLNIDTYTHQFRPLPREVTFGTQSVIYCSSCGEFRERAKSRGTIVND